MHDRTAWRPVILAFVLGIVRGCGAPPAPAPAYAPRRSIPAITAALARPHARAIAGDAPVAGFDSVGQVFSLLYDTPTADGVTEISVSENTYPNGYRVEIRGRMR